MKTERIGRVPSPRWYLVGIPALVAAGVLVSGRTRLPAEDPKRPEVKQTARPEHADGRNSYDQISPVLLGQESLRTRTDKDLAEKPAVAARQQKLLEDRYDLAIRLHKSLTMSRGKSIAVGPTTRLPDGVSWDKLAALPAEEVREKGLFPKGFLPLPHPKHASGGMLFPQTQIKAVPRLERFDIDFDLPDHFLPEYPPAIYLTTRPDLGDVSRGKVVSLDNFQELFQGILNPKDLEGMRLLVTQFPQQQFNATADRKTLSADGMRGVSCFDCHVNGHTSAATHQVGDIRPQNHRRRLDTVSLRGLYAQRLFGSQRAMRSVEDFTEFEQRAAYFDGDHVVAAAKGTNVLDRGTQVHFMAEVQSLLDFPPAPGLGWDGKLDPKKFGPDSAEMKGQKLFFGKARCAECHPAPFYTDGAMHDLKVDRFFQPHSINGLVATAQGPIKTFPLRGIKDSPPYLHDGRLLTLEDTVEFFNLVLELRLTAAEKADLVAFMLRL